MRTGYKYHFITAAVFIAAGLILWIKPSLLQGVKPETVSIVALLLAVWGIFRGLNGYFMYRKSRNQNES